MIKEIEESAKSFIDYQAKTEVAIASLRGGALKGLVAEFNGFGITDPEILKMFNEKVKYLEDFLEGKFERNLSDNLEKESIAEIKSIMSGGSSEKSTTSKKTDKQQLSEAEKNLLEGAEERQL